MTERTIEEAEAYYVRKHAMEAAEEYFEGVKSNLARMKMEVETYQSRFLQAMDPDCQDIRVGGGDVLGWCVNAVKQLDGKADKAVDAATKLAKL